MNTPINNINMNNNKGSQQPNISIQQPNSSNKINMNNLVNQNQPETHSDKDDNESIFANLDEDNELVNSNQPDDGNKNDIIINDHENNSSMNDVSDDKGRVYKKKITLLDFCNTIKDLDFSKIELSRLP